MQFKNIEGGKPRFLGEVWPQQKNADAFFASVSCCLFETTWRDLLGLTGLVWAAMASGGLNAWVFGPVLQRWAFFFGPVSHQRTWPCCWHPSLFSCACTHRSNHLHFHQCGQLGGRIRTASLSSRSLVNMAMSRFAISAVSTSGEPLDSANRMANQQAMSLSVVHE